MDSGHWEQRGSERRWSVLRGQKAPADLQAIVHRLGSRTGSVDPTSSWARSRLEHVGVYDPSRHWDGRGVGQGESRERMGNRRHPRPREGPGGGRIGALAASACVRAPVCCGYGYDCDSRGARGDPAQALRGAKTLDRGARVLGVMLVEELQRVGG
jgi:hypothetical protein